MARRRAFRLGWSERADRPRDRESLQPRRPSRLTRLACEAGDRVRLRTRVAASLRASHPKNLRLGGGSYRHLPGRGLNPPLTSADRVRLQILNSSHYCPRSATSLMRRFPQLRRNDPMAAAVPVEATSYAFDDR